MSSAELLGRKDELNTVERLLAPALKGPGILMLEGEAGIGKTTIWLEGIERARRRGFRVLSCRPSPTEAPLAFSALGDVLSELTGGFLRRLPPPQRNALEISLFLRDSEGAVPDQRAVSLAALTLLRIATKKTPLLVAIDDVQWLDASSARVLAFVFRRIEHERCRVLLARRIADGADSGFPLDIEFAPGLPETLEHLTVGPLSLGALQSLIRGRLSVRLPRRLIISICEASGGNPFYALELARAQIERGALEPGEPLQVPESLSGLVHRRLSALPPATQNALLIATTLANPTVTVLDKSENDSLSYAVEAGILEIENERIRFTHPLRASVVYAESTSWSSILATHSTSLTKMESRCALASAATAGRRWRSIARWSREYCSASVCELAITCVRVDCSRSRRRWPSSIQIFLNERVYHRVSMYVSASPIQGAGQAARLVRGPPGWDRRNDSSGRVLRRSATRRRREAARSCALDMPVVAGAPTSTCRLRAGGLARYTSPFFPN
ncbi:MAG: AAA family ATPase [Gaiellaceae bacterium]|jgi:hypothetical protein